MFPIIAVLIFMILLGVLIVTYKFSQKQPASDSLVMVYHEDGLQDVFLGMVLLVGGVALIADYMAFVGLIFVVLYPILLAAKQRITAARLRPDDLSPGLMARRRAGMSIVISVALILGLLLFALFALRTGDQPRWLDHWLDLYLLDTLLLVLIGLLLLWGFRSGVKRLFIYAGLFFVARVSSFWLDIDFPYYILGLGAIILFIGLSVTAQFIRDHPKERGTGPA